ncbi:MAG: hypothetical protein AAF666_01975 [Pseudomonadota bacterium]
MYLAYGLFAGAGAVYALMEDQTQLAIVIGGIGAVLIWKATQTTR